MLTWAEAIVWALKLLFRVTSYLQTHELVDAGGAQKITEIWKAQADDLHKLQSTMAAAGKRFDDAGGVLPDIKYRD